MEKSYTCAFSGFMRKTSTRSGSVRIEDELTETRTETIGGGGLPLLPCFQEKISLTCSPCPVHFAETKFGCNKCQPANLQLT